MKVLSLGLETGGADKSQALRSVPAVLDTNMDMRSMNGSFESSNNSLSCELSSFSMIR